MHSPSQFSFVLVLLVLLGCNKPYSEVQRGVLTTPTGQGLQVMEINVPKEHFLPVYTENEIPLSSQFDLIKEITFLAVKRVTDPAPTKESLSESLSFEAHRNNANAIILVSYGPNPHDRKVRGFIEYKITAKLIHLK